MYLQTHTKPGFDIFCKMVGVAENQLCKLVYQFNKLLTSPSLTTIPSLSKFGLTNTITNKVNVDSLIRQHTYTSNTTLKVITIEKLELENHKWANEFPKKFVLPY